MIILQDIYSFHSYFKYFTITQSVFEHFGCILKGYNRARCNQLIYFQNGLTTNQVRLALQLGLVRSQLICS